MNTNAARMGVHNLASHQPVWQLYGVLSFTCSVLNQAVVIFAPQYSTTKTTTASIAAGSKDSNNNDNNNKKVIQTAFCRTVLLLGFCVGLSGGTIIIILFNNFPQMFSSSSHLYPTMQKVAPFAFFGLILNGMDTVLEGLLIANNNSRYLGFAMWMNCLVVFLFTTISNTLSKEATVGIFSVWSCLVVFFVSRVSLNFWKTRKLFFPVKY